MTDPRVASVPRDEPAVSASSGAPAGEPWLTFGSFEHCRGDDVRRAWRALLAQTDNLYVQYQSPEWFDHLCHTRDPGLLPPLLVYDGGRVVGIVPLILGEREMRIDVRERTLWRSRIRAVSILGSQPLLDGPPALHDRIFEAIATATPRAAAIYLHSVPTDSALWRHLEHSRRLRQAFRIYTPGGVRTFHALALPARFEAYCEKFGRKKRYNLRRQLRLLGERCGGEPRARRVESVDEVAAFLDAARQVTDQCRSGQREGSRLARVLNSPDALVDQARRGLLRAYILDAGGRPTAIVLGYQYGGVYHYAEIAYDRSLAELSPGAGLLYLLLEDLTQHRSPRWVNFGIGSAPYKREFGNIQRSDASVLLLRRTLANAARVAAHRGASAVLNAAKRSARRARGG